MDVYKSALSWNGIADNVSVNVVKHVSGMPTSGFTGGVQGDVYGVALDDYTLGTTYFYGSNGQRIETDNATAVYSVLIVMNTNTSVFRNAHNPTQAAKKSFTHEVGHALMLTHPLEGSYSGHSMSGKPYSVMNQGLYGMYSHIAMSPMIHDKSNLEDKWD